MSQWPIIELVLVRGPLPVTLILQMANDRALMEKHTSGRFENISSWLVILVMIACATITSCEVATGPLRRGHGGGPNVRNILGSAGGTCIRRVIATQGKQFSEPLFVSEATHAIPRVGPRL